ncbi:permease [Nocardia sp. NPDC003482]|uniref:permease n=1 Tax=Nocardia sp. NPDC004068 TaxID=3364303 RepID=UPI0036A147E8
MTSPTVEQPSGTGSAHPWRNRIIGLGLVIVVLVIAYLVLSAFIPRWWAQRVSDMSGHGSFAKGIWSGLVLGFAGTLIPLLLLLAAALMWRRRGGRFVAGAAAVLAIVAALPNLMTLSIVAGGSNAAHAGERVLDVDAPGFRGATLVGAIVAAVLFVLLLFLLTRRRLRKRGGKHRADTAARPVAPAPPPGEYPDPGV